MDSFWDQWTVASDLIACEVLGSHSSFVCSCSIGGVCVCVSDDENVNMILLGNESLETRLSFCIYTVQQNEKSRRLD